MQNNFVEKWRRKIHQLTAPKDPPKKIGILLHLSNLLVNEHLHSFRAEFNPKFSNVKFTMTKKVWARNNREKTVQDSFTVSLEGLEHDSGYTTSTILEELLKKVHALANKLRNN